MQVTQANDVGTELQVSVTTYPGIVKDCLEDLSEKDLTVAAAIMQAEKLLKQLDFVLIQDQLCHQSVLSRLLIELEEKHCIGVVHTNPTVYSYMTPEEKKGVVAKGKAVINRRRKFEGQISENEGADTNA